MYGSSTPLANALDHVPESSALQVAVTFFIAEIAIFAKEHSTTIAEIAIFAKREFYHDCGVRKLNNASQFVSDESHKV
jgi:hypothetical protein